MYNCIFDENIDYSNSDPSKFAPTLKYLRNKNNLSINALSKRVGISPKTLEKLETEGPNHISSSVKKLCDFYGLNYPQLLNSSGDKTEVSNSIASTLKEARLKLKKTIQDVSDDTTITKGTLYNIESGRICKKINYSILFEYYDLDKDLLNNFFMSIDKLKENKVKEKEKKLNMDLDTNSQKTYNNPNMKINFNSSIEDIQLNNFKYENNVNNTNNILDSFYRKIIKDNPYSYIVKETSISYGVEFNYLGYSSGGDVSLFYPIIIKDVLDTNLVKSIKMEYLLFLNEYKNFNPNAKLKFILCIIGNKNSQFTDFKEILFDLFSSFENFEVITYYIDELIKKEFELMTDNRNNTMLA